MTFIHRAGRFTRDRACFPVVSIAGFSFLLTWIFILYHPSPGPGDIQQLGWQSWEVVDLNVSLSALESGAEGPTNNDSGYTDSDGMKGTPAPDDTGWWDVEAETANKVDLLSLPLDKWNPLLPHNTVSELTVVQCWMDPFFVPNYCAPQSTPEQDAIRGKWVRVGANLNERAGRLAPYLFIYYRRTRRQDVNVVDNIVLLGSGASPGHSDEGEWRKVDLSLRSGVTGASPLYLWYHLGKTTGQMSDEDKATIITEIDVLYGQDVPFYGFETLEPPSMAFIEGQVEGTQIAYRRGVKRAPRAPPPHFSHDGKYKIMQVADLHFSVSPGVCRDVSIPDCSHSDNMTSSLISRILDLENPDLVVFTGDQLNGQGTSWHPRSVIAKFSKALTEREKPIPWSAVFGNHDEESGRAKKAQQIEMMKALPYSIIDRGPEDVHGEGNYLVKVKSADPSKTHLLTLYFLDSGNYIKSVLDWFNFFSSPGYDYIRASQINWFLQQSASIKPISRPFQPDTAKDFGHIWGRRNFHPVRTPSPDPQQVPSLEKKLAKPNAMVFFHIPLPESYSPADKDPETGKALDVGTHGLEGPGNSDKSDGFFEKGILVAKESEHVAHGSGLEVKVIGNGHSHLTDNCRRVKGVWLCFGGGGSYSAYGKPDFDRRFRIYDISEYGETIRTWKRTDHGAKVDEMVIAGRGAPGM